MPRDANTFGSPPRYSEAEEERRRSAGYQKAKRYIGARMNISSSVSKDEAYRLQKEYDVTRKAVGLDK